MIDVGASTFTEKLAVSLFSFMRMSGMRCSFQKDPDKLFNYIFQVNDMTEDGNPFGLGFVVDVSLSEAVEDTPEAIEKFCYAMALKTQVMMVEDKMSRLLQHVEKSKIYLPSDK